MNVVLDTNVVVSAFLSPAGKPAAILGLVLQGKLSICVNTAILSEYEQVLSRQRFIERMHHTDIRRFMDIIYTIGIKVNAVPSAIELPDESDRTFYDCAKAAKANLVTGNKRHYPDEPFIQDPAEFLSRTYPNI